MEDYCRENIVRALVVELRLGSDDMEHMLVQLLLETGKGFS